MSPATKTVKGRRAGRSAALPLDVDAARAFVALHVPGAEVAEKFGNASFSVGGKVFAFTRPDGLVLKLAEDVLADIVSTREAKHLVMGKRVMREWVVLALATRDRYKDEVALLGAAMGFVRSLAGK